MAEQDTLGLHGLLPPHVSSQDEQVKRGMDSFNRKTGDLEKYVFMIAMDLKVIWAMSVTCCPGRAELGGHRG